MTAQRQNPAPLIVFYALYFMTTGITLPFLPPYLQTLGLTTSQVGLLLSIAPAATIVCPPLWGQWVDRSGRPGLILTVLVGGASVGLAVLLGATTFTSACLALILMATFASAITTVVDTLALHQVQTNGGSYATLRVFGSAGFVVSTLTFGFVWNSIDRSTVMVPLVLMLLTTVWTGFTLRNRTIAPGEGPKASLHEAFKLLKKPAVLWLLVATSLHWLASAPYHAALGIHFSAMHFPPLTIGISSFIAVTSEIVVMATSPGWMPRFSSRSMLIAAFAVSVLRWFCMSMTDNPVVLCALASLHGVSFGAFYIAAVTAMTDLAPGSMRATGQALFVATTFGLGGLLGNSLTGVIYDAVGGHALFATAGLFEVLPLVVILLAPPIVHRPTTSTSGMQ